MDTRTPPHHLNMEAMGFRYGICRKRREAFGEGRPRQLERRNPLFFVGYAQDGIELAGLAYLFDEPLSDVVRYGREPLAELKTAVEFGYSFVQDQFRRFLLVAIAFERGELTEYLCSLPDKVFRAPTVVASECSYNLNEALQAAGKGNMKACASKTVAARELLVPEKLVVNPREETAIYEPQVALLESLVARDQARLEQTWEARHSYWKRTYARKSAQGDYVGILDFELIGLGRLTRDAGLEAPVGNPYAPRELLMESAKA